MNSRPERRRVAAITGAAALALTAFVALAEPAAAESVTFDCVEANQEWRVPAGVTSATFDVFGAQGGKGNEEGGRQPLGGKGGRATTTLAVTPGESITVTVGCKGDAGRREDFAPGGFGAGRGGNAFGGGGSGGGASSVRGIVAGGGGGSGQSYDGGGVGGAGGALIADDGDAGYCPAPPSFTAGGEGATGIGPGKGGTNDCDISPPDGSPYWGSDGHGATGGEGGRALNIGRGGGAGGGGHFGGGGGAVGGLSGGGGGGGSGTGPAGTTFERGVRSRDGVVIITWSAPAGEAPAAPPAPSGSPTTVPPATAPNTAPKPATPARPTAAQPRFTG